MTTPVYVPVCPDPLAHEWRGVRADLVRNRYTQRVPASVEEIDRPIAEQHPCICCGASACRYEGWAQWLDGRMLAGSYRAYAVCRACGHWIDF